MTTHARQHLTELGAWDLSSSLEGHHHVEYGVDVNLEFVNPGPNAYCTRLSLNSLSFEDIEAFGVALIQLAKELKDAEVN